MRTKALLLTAALGVAGVATSMAQVYSVNAVGYINKTVQPGFNLIANQLNQTTQTLDALLPTVAEDTTFYKFVAGPGGGFQIRQYTGGVWDPDGAPTIAPGDGFFLNNISGSAFTVTFVGEVPTGTLNVGVQSGFNMVSSKVPQSGLITTDLGLPAAEDDFTYQFFNNGTTSGYIIRQYTGGVWDPDEPNLSVGEAFWLNTSTARTWTRTFTVN